MTEQNTSPESLKALNKLTVYLANRDHSEKELIEKLKKNFNSEAITWAITEAHKNQWIKPPEELAEQVARSLHHKNKSIATNDELEKEKCLKLLLSKFKKDMNFSYEEKIKAHRFLSYRGFLPETIRCLLK